MGIRSLLLGTAAGAEAMYWLDPALGKRRRSMLRDKTVSLCRRSSRGLDTAVRDLQHRAVGVVADFRSAFTGQPTSDSVLVERVRSKIGRAVSHPGAIEVRVRDGNVCLAGPILAHEVDHLLRTVRCVRGVHGIDNHLDVHKEPGNIGALQGGRRRTGDQADIMQANWAPATRLLVGGAGGLLMANCLARRTPGAALLGTLGFGMFLRAVTNIETRRLLGGTERRTVDLQKTIRIEAPVDRVFDFLAKGENMPRAIPHVKSVRRLDNGCYRWQVEGPGGATLQWDERITKADRNECLAWKSEPDSVIGHAGVIQFEADGDNATRVHVRMSYSPPAGVLGHAAASLLGIDPKSQLDEAMIRIKTFLETGKQPHDAPQKVSSEEAARLVGREPG